MGLLLVIIWNFTKLRIRSYVLPKQGGAHLLEDVPEFQDSSPNTGLLGLEHVDMVEEPCRSSAIKHVRPSLT